MQPLTTLNSRVIMLDRDDIDTDQIIPARFLTTIGREGLGRNAFEDWRRLPDGAPDPACPLNDPALAGAAILLAGRNFGCGSSREHAAWALADLGIRAVISSKIADIFAANAAKNGIAALTIAEPDHRRLLESFPDRLEVDLGSASLRRDGAAIAFDIDPFARHCLMNGVDELGFLLGAMRTIEAFEARHDARSPAPWRCDMRATIAVLGGDGIGPEVTAEAVRVLEAIATTFDHGFTFEPHAIGGAGIDATGGPLPGSTLEACRAADAVLLGSVGGPRWDGLEAPLRPERGLLRLREGLGVFANLRPTRVFVPLIDRSPLRAERAAGIDMVIVRELTGGIYFGAKEEGETAAADRCAYTAAEVERVTDVAGRIASGRAGRVVSVDKANVLATSRLWRRTVTRRMEAAWPGIELEHMLVDAAAMRLVTDPSSFDVILTENMFGDILSDEAAALTGTLGMAPSASIGSGGPGLFEPVHGSAPDIVGAGAANPYAAILSAAMLLRDGLGLEEEAAAVEGAVSACVAAGILASDLAPAVAATTGAIGRAVAARVTRGSTVSA